MSRSYDGEPHAELMRELVEARRGGWVLDGWVLDGFRVQARKGGHPIPRAAKVQLVAESLRGGRPIPSDVKSATRDGARYLISLYERQGREIPERVERLADRNLLARGVGAVRGAVNRGLR